MTDTDSKDAGCSPTPLAYRANKHSDWGEINCRHDGVWAVLAKINCHLKPGGGIFSEDELDDHRKNGTDPAGEWAKQIIHAANSHAALEAERDRLREALKRVLVDDDVSSWTYYTDRHRTALRDAQAALAQEEPAEEGEE